MGNVAATPSDEEFQRMLLELKTKNDTLEENNVKLQTELLEKNQELEELKKELAKCQEVLSKNAKEIEFVQEVDALNENLRKNFESMEPQLPPEGAIALPPGMRSGIVIRADGSQYCIYKAAPPGMQAGNASSPNTTYRLQSLQGSVPGFITTLSPQQVPVVSFPVLSSSVQTIQTGTGGQIVRTISPQQMAVMTQALTKAQQPQTVVSTVMQKTTTTMTQCAASSTTASSGAMSPNTIKIKCKNFLSTLIRLTGGEATKTASNVKKLIQNLIDGTIEPEEFSTQLQKELQSKHQPHLIHFLKKSLPHVRQALMTGEITIEGIRPPPLPVSVQSVVSTTQEFKQGVEQDLASEAVIPISPAEEFKQGVEQDLASEAVIPISPAERVCTASPNCSSTS